MTTAAPILIAVSAALVLVGRRVAAWVVLQGEAVVIPSRVRGRIGSWERHSRAISAACVVVLAVAVVAIVIGAGD